MHLARGDDALVVDVVDDGVGLPEGFSVGRVRGLGLSIVQSLVTTELGGSMEMRSGPGTCVRLTIPLPAEERRRSDQAPQAPVRLAARRCSATHVLRSLRRSSSVVPPQMPAS